MPKKRLVSLFALAIPFGCVASPIEADGTATEAAATEWERANHPASYIGSSFIYEATSLPVEGAPQLSPLASDYWSTAEDSVNRRWDGEKSMSPAEKFELAFNRRGFAAAVSAKLGTASVHNRPVCKTTSDCAASNDGSVCVGSGKVKACVPTWWGICHGIASATVHEPSIADSIVYNGVTFYRADIEALRGALYAEGEVKSQALPSSCGNNATKVTNQSGSAAKQCRVSDAGAWHVLMTNVIGVRHQGFVYDRFTGSEVWNQPTERFTGSEVWNQPTERFTGSEVWNQPVSGFKVTNAKDGHLAEISKQDADKILGPNSSTVANALAKRFFDVETDLLYPKVGRASREVQDQAKLTEVVHFRYILAVGADDRILSGQWVIGKDGSGQPDFAWWPTSDPKTAINGMITYADIKTLTALAADPKQLTETRILLSDATLSGDSNYLVLGAPEKTTVTITMTGKGDADLYVREGSYPSATAFNCKSTGPTADEACTVTTGASGASYYIGVRVAKGATVSMSAKLVRAL